MKVESGGGFGSEFQLVGTAMEKALAPQVWHDMTERRLTC